MSAFAKQTSIAKALALGIALSMTLSLPAFSDTPSSPAIPSPAIPSLAIQRQGVNSFEPGDLVRLRSGGPVMTVDSVKGDQVDCFWTGMDDEVNAESFPIDVLQKF